MHTAFHLAIPVTDLQKARAFYKDFLGAKEGRSDPLWVDFNFFGHQLTCHLVDKKELSNHSNQVDGKTVPIPHFGLVVEEQNFYKFKEQVEKEKIDFLLKPQTRFKDKTEEHKTMFFKDPFGHCIEIKSFTKTKGF